MRPYFQNFCMVVVDLLAEVLDDLLLEVEAGEDAVERLEVLVEFLLKLLLAARVLGGELAEEVVVLLDGAA